MGNRKITRYFWLIGKELKKPRGVNYEVERFRRWSSTQECVPRKSIPTIVPLERQWPEGLYDTCYFLEFGNSR